MSENFKHKTLIPDVEKQLVKLILNEVEKLNVQMERGTLMLYLRSYIR